MTRRPRDIAGAVHAQDEILRYYSVDSGSYRVRPDIVISPRDVQDIARIVRYAVRTGTPVTARGAGTGLVGSALNRGIALDMRGFDRIHVDSGTVTVGAGVQKGLLDQTLKGYGKLLGVNPSVGPYCSVGGMIGSNASGGTSLRYGSTIDSITHVILVDGTGRIVRLPSDRLASKIYDIARRIDTGRYPRVSKNSSGYRLDRITARSDAARIVAGSEGTLGIVVEARLRVHDIPKSRTLFIVRYRTERQAMADVGNILRARPTALEFVDCNVISQMPDRPAGARAMLFVEFAGRRQALKTAGTVHARLTRISDIDRWWRYRNSALGYSMKRLGDVVPAPHMIEDAAVPVDRIVELWDIIQGISERYGHAMIVYGHAGDGNLHIRMGVRGKKRLRDIASRFFADVIDIGGTISGEHGDGIARTWFVPRQYGRHNYGLFRELKRLMDPHGILNPGKIVSR